MKKCIQNQSEIIKFKDELKEVNSKLWDVENGKKVANKSLVKNLLIFLELYKLNDKRAISNLQ